MLGGQILPRHGDATAHALKGADVHGDRSL